MKQAYLNHVVHGVVRETENAVAHHGRLGDARERKSFAKILELLLDHLDAAATRLDLLDIFVGQ